MKRFLKNEKASMTLEAALVVPFFLLFIMFLVTLVRISVAQLALNNATAETAQVISTHAYPAGLLVKSAEGKLDDLIQESSYDTLTLDKATELLKDAMESAGIDFDLGSTLNNLSAQLIQPFVQNKFEDSIGGYFNKEDVKVIRAEGIMNLNKGADSYVDIEAQYTLDINIPFVHKQIVLTSRAYEKMWVGS